MQRHNFFFVNVILNSSINQHRKINWSLCVSKHSIVSPAKARCVWCLFYRLLSLFLASLRLFFSSTLCGIMCHIVPVSLENELKKTHLPIQNKRRAYIMCAHNFKLILPLSTHRTERSDRNTWFLATIISLSSIHSNNIITECLVKIPCQLSRQPDVYFGV